MSEPSGSSGPPPLLVDGRLDRVPGGPYDPEAVEIAAGTVRGEAGCGWHIAPEWTEELQLDHRGGDSLMLPTLRVVEVLAVTDRAGRPLTGWEWSNAGVLTRAGGWPVGLRAVHVVLEHGYRDAPADIVGLVAELARTVGTREPGQRSFTRTVGGVTTIRSFSDTAAGRGVLDAFAHVIDAHRVTVPTW